jgi:regulatory protein
MDELKITDIRQAVKNENRVNIFVNGKYSFSLDISQVVDFRLKKGEEISAEQLEEYKKASEFGKLYQRTLEWVLTRPRSVRETSDYLFKKTFEKKLDKNYIDRIIEKLVEKKYLDDAKFAAYYVENRFVKKGISQKRLRMELIKKGVASSIVDEVLGGRNDEEEIKKMILKKRGRYDDEKLIAYLCRQGFDYQLVKDLVRSCGTDSQSLE